MRHRGSPQIPADFRARLEVARLDTLASLQHLPAARDAVRTRVPAPPRVAALEANIRADPDLREACKDIPGHSPQDR